MADATKNKTFYAAIAGCIVGLFAMMVIPCFIAMCVARYSEKRQLHRDALAREAAEDDSTDYLVYGPFPYDSSLYHVDEVGESSGYRAPNNSVESLDSAIQLDGTLEDDAAIAMALAEQEDDIAITATEQNLANLREPQYEGKGKALMYPHIQEVLVDQQEQQLSESVQAQLPGPIQESLSERLPAALAELPAELPAEQKAAEESQDAPEAVPKAAPAENEH